MTASKNRNLGSKNSHGEIICFLDDDDYFLPGKISDCVAFFGNNMDKNFVFGRTEQVDGSGELIVSSFGSLDLADLLRYRYVHCNSLAVRRTTMLMSPFNESMDTFEDVEFVGRLFRQHEGGAIDRVHAVWIRDNRSDQLTSRDYGRAFRNWKILCETFAHEIAADRRLSRFYQLKMLALSVIARAPRQAIRSLYRLIAAEISL
jgi:glycosyltransferase involved in cell wall biosynthesis